MTATVNRRRQIVLRADAREKLKLATGDLLIVARNKSGAVVLRKQGAGRRTKAYLNPPPLPSGVLERIYAQPASEWDKVESEAVALSRRALTRQRLEEL